MLEDYKKEMLTSAYEMRQREITEYQVNIDNFRLAIEKIKDDEELKDFKNTLQDLLKSNLLEQRKSQVMYEVIKSQLEE